MAEGTGISGWERLKEGWRDVAPKVQNEVRYSLGRYITFLINYAKKNKLSGQVLGKYRGMYNMSRGQSRWRKRPGELKRSLSGRKVDDFEFSIWGKVYGRAWEYGFSRPGFFVRPRVAKALTWYTGSEWAFSRGHYIRPQTFAARPWMRPSVAETWKQFRNMVLRPMMRAVFGRA